jgi:hypothetical protein
MKKLRDSEKIISFNNTYFERSLKWAPVFDMADKKEGYLDDVFDVLDANCHSRRMVRKCYRSK